MAVVRGGGNRREEGERREWLERGGGGGNRREEGERREWLERGGGGGQ